MVRILRHSQRKRRDPARLNLQSMAPVLDPTTHRRPDATREAPAVIAVSINWQLAERQAGPCGVAERFVVPMKPGNSGRGKGPQLKTDATSDEGHGD
jgi:hypothetical protein